MSKTAIAVLVCLVLDSGNKVYAAHPLITDDTGTQGKGKAQLEFVGEYGHDKEGGATTNSITVPTAPVLTYGIADTVDLVLSSSYQRIETEAAGVSSTAKGISDTSVELKWRFHEKNGLSFAVKPGVTLPTGDEEKGLGAGRPSFGIMFITTKEAGPWNLHANLGYTHSEYKLEADEDANRKGIWHASLASEYAMLHSLKLAANIGVERNPDKTRDTNPVFLLGGFIYSLSENFDIDAGVKAGLNDAEADLTALAGIALRF